jgi:hypothetical protein
MKAYCREGFRIVVQPYPDCGKVGKAAQARSLFCPPQPHH